MSLDTAPFHSGGDGRSLRRMGQPVGTGRFAFIAATAAVVLASAFTYWALTASAYSSGETLLEANPETLARVALWTPLAVTVAVWLLLHLACRFDLRAAKVAGCLLAGVLSLFAFVTGFSIGLFVMPAAGMLMMAAVFTPVRGRL